MPDDSGREVSAIGAGVGRRDLFQSLAFMTAGVAMASADTAMAAMPAIPKKPARPPFGSRLDPDGLQILFADLQMPLVAKSKTADPAALSKAAGVLAKVGTILGIPSFFSVVPEGDAPPHLIPELRPYATSANMLLRTPVSPFHHPPTVAALARNHRRTLVIAGFAAEVVVIQAALDAMAAGYEVFYVVDAIGGLSERTESAIFRDMDRAGAIPTSVVALATRLVHDFITAPGMETSAALAPLEL